MISANDRSSPSRIHWVNATANTVTPDCAASVAASSSTPRAPRASASIVARVASLCSSRSCSAGFWSITDWRRREWGRRSSGKKDAADRRAEATTSIGDVPGGAASTPARNAWASWCCPEKRTSRLSLKWRKKVRSVRPTDWAISAAVVCSNPRVANSSSAAFWSRSGAPGSQRTMPSSVVMAVTDVKA